MRRAKLLAAIAVATTLTIGVRAYSTYAKWPSDSAGFYINPQNADVSDNAAVTAVLLGAEVWETQSGALFDVPVQRYGIRHHQCLRQPKRRDFQKPEQRQHNRDNLLLVFGEYVGRRRHHLLGRGFQVLYRLVRLFRRDLHRRCRCS